jgi:hypothetical protein
MFKSNLIIFEIQLHGPHIFHIQPVISNGKKHIHTVDGLPVILKEVN